MSFYWAGCGEQSRLIYVAVCPGRGCPSITWFCSHLSLYLLLRTNLRVLIPSREGVSTSVPGIGWWSPCSPQEPILPTQALSPCHPQPTTGPHFWDFSVATAKQNPCNPGVAVQTPAPPLSLVMEGRIRALSHALLKLHSPNIQTSLAVVKRRKLMDSGDIHLMGRRVTEALGGQRDSQELFSKERSRIIQNYSLFSRDSWLGLDQL